MTNQEQYKLDLQRYLIPKTFNESTPEMEFKLIKAGV